MWGVDLGSGAGLPGLFLALHWRGSRWRLVEAKRRRARALVEAVAELGLGTRVGVFAQRAEAVSRLEGWRGAHDVATARSFGPPGVTAECAAPLLEVGGRLLVSEPPGETGERWPEGALGVLGLRAEGLAGRAARVMVLRQAEPCPERYPRRAPHKRPLF